jgi:hypothetical protein
MLYISQVNITNFYSIKDNTNALGVAILNLPKSPITLLKDRAVAGHTKSSSRLRIELRRQEFIMFRHSHH